MLTREINPFGLRMPADLKQRLDYKAKENNRSLNAELVYRLQESLSTDGLPVSREGTAMPYKADLPIAEQQILSVFRRLPAEKQLALLSLFK